MAKTPTPVVKPEDETPNAPPVETVQSETQPEPEAPKEPVESEAVEGGSIEARILVDHAGFKCDTLALLTEAQAADCKGWADTSEAAVAFMKSRD